MLKSEMQHQFWVTKKAVQRRLGSKEDACIVSSDAELDAKIELFKSISDSCGHLYRIIDHYQERLCILAQEENCLGKFLKESGKNSNTTGKVMQSAGKSISYCGQQRMTIRPSLLRLHHEVETFRGRAIADTYATITTMEKERTEYRAALSWMKSVSSQLDPDSGRGLEKFRKAQTHVRVAKTKFDRLALDCLEKIDLLAAARCNMFSHALVAYMAALLQFSTKSSETFKLTAKALSAGSQYNFCILKDLSQMPTDGEQTNSKETKPEVTPIDDDQMLFFLDDYKDENLENKAKSKPQANQQQPDKQQPRTAPQPASLIDIATTADPSATADLLANLKEPIVDSQPETKTTKKPQKSLEQLLDLSDDFGDFVSAQTQPLSFMPSQLLLAETNHIASEPETLQPSSSASHSAENSVTENPSDLSEAPKGKNSILEFFNIASLSKQSAAAAALNNTGNSSSTGIDASQQQKSTSSAPKSKDKKKDMSAWFQLFAELDPLANLDAIARKIDGDNDCSQAA